MCWGNPLSCWHRLLRGKIKGSTSFVSSCLACREYHAFVCLTISNVVKVGNLSELLAFLFLIFVWGGSCNSYAHRLQVWWRKKFEVFWTARRSNDRSLLVPRLRKEKIISALSFEINCGGSTIWVLSCCCLRCHRFYSRLDFLCLGSLDNLDPIGVKSLLLGVSLGKRNLIQL